MKSMKLGMMIVLLLGLGIEPMAAQFTFSGEFRPRTEFNRGYKALAEEGQQPSLFTSQRTRLNLFHQSEHVHTSLVLQDVRLFGSQPQLVGNHDFGVSVHQAWAEVFFHKHLSLRVGRQELVYDNARILGNVDWVQQARTHDLALVRYEGVFKAHMGLAYHESGNITNNLYLGPDAYKAMQFLWLNHRFGNLTGSLLILNNGVPFNTLDTLGNITDQQIHYSQTIGTHLVLPWKKFRFMGYLYAQTGKAGSGAEIRDAYNACFEAGYRLHERGTLTLGFEYLSGKSELSTSQRISSFTPLYGTNHAFNGWMDYFYVGNHINSVGLVNPYLKGVYQHGRFTFTTHIHYFLAAADVADPDDPLSAMPRELGTECDLMVQYSISPQASIMLGYSRMFGTSTLAAIRGGDPDATSHWAWCQLIVRPTFFRHP